MKKYISNRKIFIRYCFLVLLMSISFYSCILQKPYAANIAIFQPAFLGEIKENTLKGMADTTVVFITGKVSDYKSPAGKGMELIFINKENNKEFKAITDSNGDFEKMMGSGSYTLKIIPYKYGRTPRLNFENLNFNSGDIREIIIHTESSAETVGIDTIFRSKRAHNKYLRRQ
ncbi:hypothetical protein Celal_4057 [Cellulophaga algicola DSM 14237]|uniref:Carboxypeptidase regulatory-like domain-containing protein n=1 Tax=Cellulophaga algicola (strain DSM 14237 / IC166 / ACAM 630) TaxID=688270 RepID=E6XDW2_CELAD|nr:hypothetical protein [Cellulophaga algicola]ADV51300.1 hypothetical protein Celal_4057 [Cellulophaga algicola DSM 14237]